MNLSIGAKIRLCVVLVFLIASTSGLIAVFETSRMNEAVLESQILASRVGVAGDIEYLTAQRMVAARGYLVYREEKYIEEFDQATTKMENLLKNLLEETRREENRILVHQLIDVNREYTHIIKQNVVPLGQSGNFAEAAAVSQRDALPVVERMFDTAEYYSDKRKGELSEVTGQTVEINRETQQHIWLAIAGALLVGLLLSQLIIKGIVRSLHELNLATRQMAEGDLTRQVAVKTGDEVGELATTFAQMARQLRHLIRDIINKADGLADRSHELSIAGNQAAQSVQSITKTTVRVADTAEEEALQAQRMVTAINNVERHLSDAHLAVEKNTNAMRSIHRAVDNSSTIIKELSKQSRQISQINYTIENIAEKTSMLAISASIEATRAGEHGLGFGAVVEEIRKLAEQSSDAIRQFNTIIEDIQSGAARAVRSMEEGTGQAVLGVETAVQVKRVLDHNLTELETAAGLIREIARGIEETKYATRELVENAEETSAAIDEIAAAAHGLALMAQQYRDLVGSFKIDAKSN